MDLVPNHCSDQHAAFQAALAAPAGSPERDMFIFRDGTGTRRKPPNNWQSHFGGSAWTRITEPDGTPGQWYLHLFDSSQPDFNWDNLAVHEEFERVLRFWLDRGVSGFRVDVAHALVKAPGLARLGRPRRRQQLDGFPGHDAPMFGQPALHDIYRPGARSSPSTDGTGSSAPKRTWTRSPGSPTGSARTKCTRPSTSPTSTPAWTSHRTAPHHHRVADGLRHRRRPQHLGAVQPRRRPPRHPLRATTASRRATVTASARRTRSRTTTSDAARAAAASLFMLGLPGGAYLYQGEELGLPDGINIPDTQRQDPTFARTGGARLGRDGCRVPLPWRAGELHAGFGDGQDPWLPQPESFARLARDVQAASPSSHLSLYKRMLDVRRGLELGRGSLSWYEDLCTDTSIAFLNGTTLVVLNTGSEPLQLPAGRVLLRSSTSPGAGYDAADMSTAGDQLSSGETVWLEIYIEDTEG